MISFSIIIPAYNEEKYLPNTLRCAENAVNNVKQTGEIIVVDNNSTDNTAEIVNEFGAKLVFEKHNQISKARNSGAKAAEGKFLIFLDADTIISPELLSAALENMENGKCCGGGCKIEIDRKLPFSAQKFKEFWDWLSVKLSLAAGCFVYCTREGFESVGGFNEKIYASEEIWFSRKLTKWGKNKNLDFKIITDIPVITSGRKLDSTFKLWSSMLTILFFPFAIFFRRLCPHWYKK